MRSFLRNKHRTIEPLWHVQITMCFAIALQLLLPDRFIFGTKYLLPLIEALLLAALAVTTPKERIFKSLSRRINVLLLIALTSLANGYSLLLVAHRYCKAATPTTGAS